MSKKSMTKIVGIVFIIMWFSQIPYLLPHPFQEHKGIRDLATDVVQGPNWIKEASPFLKDKTADELTRSMIIELRIHWIKSALFIVFGVLSGWLIIQRRKGGYLLAFFFSLLIIGIRFVRLLWYWRVTFSLKYYEFILRRCPVRKIHEIVMYLVLLGTVIFLIYTFKGKEKEGVEE